MEFLFRLALIIGAGWLLFQLAPYAILLWAVS